MENCPGHRYSQPAPILQRLKAVISLGRAPLVGKQVQGCQRVRACRGHWTEQLLMQEEGSTASPGTSRGLRSQPHAGCPGDPPKSAQCGSEPAFTSIHRWSCFTAQCTRCPCDHAGTCGSSGGDDLPSLTSAPITIMILLT